MPKSLVLCMLLSFLPARAGTIAGSLQTPSGLPVKNGTLSFVLQQAGLAIGVGGIVPVTAQCYTSTDGSVVGLPNPLSAPVTAVNYGSGTLPAGTYYVAYTFYDASGNRTLGSPEAQVQLTGAGSLIFSPPASFPANAAGMTIFVGTASGAETAQGNTVGPTQQFTQASPPIAGAALPSSNATACSIVFNDTIIPYTGYNVSLTSSTGNAYPGWPQAWQLNGGANGTVNVSQGAPLWNGVVIYPSPVLMQPLNHGPQSISGPLNMTGYNLVNVGALGVGTATPAWPIDVENGAINASGGYLYNGGAGSTGQCLVSNGSVFAPGSCGTAPTLYYQHVEANAAFQPQEPYLNFVLPLTAVDNPSSQRTDVSLNNSGVTPGSYSNTNLTVDALGRITAASNGPSPASVKALVLTTGLCTTGSAAYNSCTISASWPTAFADANYALTCTPSGATALAETNLWFSSKTASGFSVSIQNGDTSGANAISVSEIDCIGVHP